MKKLIIYIILVVSLNIMFSVVPMIELPNGHLWSIGSILAGFIFVSRDYAQREVGHWILPAMIIAIVLSYIMADPFVAIASASAFAISEFIDWIIYSKTKRPFKERVVLSSMVACPIDTIVFLYIIDQLSILSFVVMTISKFISIAWVMGFTK